jgi:hypothetical protein
MKKVLMLTMLILLIPRILFAVEFLIKVKPSWMEALSDQERIQKGIVEEYNRRGVVGDIIVVRPGGWKWGKEECLPNFIIIKIPDMTMQEGKKYEDRLTEEVQGEIIIKKKRKYQISESLVTIVKTMGGILQTTKGNISIITKTLP